MLKDDGVSWEAFKAVMHEPLFHLKLAVNSKYLYSV